MVGLEEVGSGGAKIVVGCGVQEPVVRGLKEGEGRALE